MTLTFYWRTIKYIALYLFFGYRHGILSFNKNKQLSLSKEHTMPKNCDRNVTTGTKPDFQYMCQGD